MIARLDRFRELLREKSIDGAIIYKPENRRYLSGFTGSSGYVVVTLHEAYFITDFRYMEQAAKQCQSFKVIEHTNQYPLHRILNDFNLNSMGFEDDFVTYAQYKEFTDKLGQTNLVPLEGAMGNLRKIKSDEEISIIEKAAKIADQAFEHILTYIKAGMKENEVALELESFMKKRGASGLSFDSIVASGIRSSLPHGVASDKIIETGDFITLDFGCVYEGYCSDMTRTIVVGKASEEQKKDIFYCSRSARKGIRSD